MSQQTLADVIESMSVQTFSADEVSQMIAGAEPTQVGARFCCLVCLCARACVYAPVCTRLCACLVLFVCLCLYAPGAHSHVAFGLRALFVCVPVGSHWVLVLCFLLLGLSVEFVRLSTCSRCILVCVIAFTLF